MACQAIGSPRNSCGRDPNTAPNNTTDAGLYRPDWIGDGFRRAVDDVRVVVRRVRRGEPADAADYRVAAQTPKRDYAPINDVKR